MLLIAEVDPSASRVLQTVSDHATVVRLGQGVDQSKRIHPEAAQRTLECLTRYSEIVRQAGLDPSETRCVATSQARDSANGADFFREVQSRTGFHFWTLSGDQEAQMTFVGGLLPQQSKDRSVVVDIGGGSTEFMAIQGGQSLDLGSVRFTERYLKSNPITDREFWSCQEAIDEALSRLTPWREALASPVLTAVAGTATTLASWFLGLKGFDAAKIDGLELMRGDLHRQVEELKWRSYAERLELPGIEKGREDVLLAGALILWRTCEVLKFDRVVISTRGLRYGAILT